MYSKKRLYTVKGIVLNSLNKPHHYFFESHIKCQEPIHMALESLVTKCG